MKILMLVNWKIAGCAGKADGQATARVLTRNPNSGAAHLPT